MYVFLYVHLLHVCLFVCTSFYMYVFLYACLSVCMSFCMYVFLYACLSVCVSTSMYFCMYVLFLLNVCHCCHLMCSCFYQCSLCVSFYLFRCMPYIIISFYMYVFLYVCLNLHDSFCLWWHSIFLAFWMYVGRWHIHQSGFGIHDGDFISLGRDNLSLDVAMFFVRDPAILLGIESWCFF